MEAPISKCGLKLTFKSIILMILTTVVGTTISFSIVKLLDDNEKDKCFYQGLLTGTISNILTFGFGFLTKTIIDRKKSSSVV